MKDSLMHIKIFDSTGAITDTTSAFTSEFSYKMRKTKSYQFNFCIEHCKYFKSIKSEHLLGDTMINVFFSCRSNILNSYVYDTLFYSKRINTNSFNLKDNLCPIIIENIFKTITIEVGFAKNENLESVVKNVKILQKEILHNCDFKPDYFRFVYKFYQTRNTKSYILLNLKP